MMGKFIELLFQEAVGLISTMLAILMLRSLFLIMLRLWLKAGPSRRGGGRQGSYQEAQGP